MQKRKTLVIVLLIFIALVAALVFVLGKSGKGNEGQMTVLEEKSSTASEESVDVSRINSVSQAALDGGSLISPDDVRSSVSDAVDCGKCVGLDCGNVMNCLSTHAQSCAAATGSVNYAVPNNPEKKKTLAYAISKNEGSGECVLSGVATTENAPSDEPSINRFECVQDASAMKEFFSLENINPFLADNCTGKYVEFIKSRQLQQEQQIISQQQQDELNNKAGAQQ